VISHLELELKKIEHNAEMTDVKTSLFIFRKFENIFPLYCEQGQP